jgi:hypothetical protein
MQPELLDRTADLGRSQKDSFNEAHHNPRLCPTHVPARDKKGEIRPSIAASAKRSEARPRWVNAIAVFGAPSQNPFSKSRSNMRLVA